MGEILLAAVIVLADQLSKVGAVDLAARRGSTVMIPGVIGLTCTYNYGASWGILAGKTVFLLVLTALVCAAVFVALLLRRPKSLLSRLSLAMVLGGAVGNALDRLADGFVTDMIETLFMDFPIFNVADCFITVGAALLCIWVLTDERKNRLQRQEASRRRWEKSREAAKTDTVLAEQTRREFDSHDDVSDR